MLYTGLIAALIAPMSPVGAVAGFGDVENDKYYTESVQWSVDEGITQPNSNCFEPDQSVTRGEAAVWIWRMKHHPDAPPHNFADVTADEHQKPVAWMSHTGITTGTSDTTFSPDDTLTRGQIATFLWRLAKRPNAKPHEFKDVVENWQQEPVSWLSDTGITTGTSATTFSPDDTLTRAHLVTFLYRYNDSPPVIIDPTTPTCDPNASSNT